MEGIDRWPTRPELVLASAKQLEVLLLPPGWDARPAQGYPQHYAACTHLYTWVERDNVEQSFLSKETTRWQRSGLEQPTFRLKVQPANHFTIAPSHVYRRAVFNAAIF